MPRRSEDTKKMSMKREALELERRYHGGHEVVVATDHYNQKEGGIFTKMGGKWLGKTMLFMQLKTAKGESSLYPVWFKDAWSKIWLKPKRNYRGRFFLVPSAMHLPFTFFPLHSVSLSPLPNPLSSRPLPHCSLSQSSPQAHALPRLLPNPSFGLWISETKLYLFTNSSLSIATTFFL